MTATLLSPSFIVHQREQEDKKKITAGIFTIDVHPDNEKIITGGNDHFIRMWQMTPIVKDLQNEKELFCSNRHESTVMSVRWSKNSGNMLASGGDDGGIIIWKLKQNELFVFKKLPNMSSDVIDLAWSMDNKLLASCSLDNSLIIYQNFEKIAKCMHKSFVKGIAFDPAGKFLCSQSDDGSAMLWSTQTWKPLKRIMHPFVAGSTSAVFMRPSWSPDGGYLCFVGCISEGIHVASVVKRNQWTNIRKVLNIVGHDAAISVAKFSNSVHKRGMETTQLLALGCQSGKLSVWALEDSPILILENLFESQVTDICWSKDNKVILASSTEGKVRGISLDFAHVIGASVISKQQTKSTLKNLNPLEEIDFEMNQMGIRAIATSGDVFKMYIWNESLIVPGLVLDSKAQFLNIENNMVILVTLKHTLLAYNLIEKSLRVYQIGYIVANKKFKIDSKLNIQTDKKTFLFHESLNSWII